MTKEPFCSRQQTSSRGGRDEGSPTRRCSEREPADSLRDKLNVIGGWFPSLTYTLGQKCLLNITPQEGRNCSRLCDRNSHFSSQIMGTSSSAFAPSNTSIRMPFCIGGRRLRLLSKVSVTDVARRLRFGSGRRSPILQVISFAFHGSQQSDIQNFRSGNSLNSEDSLFNCPDCRVSLERLRMICFGVIYRYFLRSELQSQRHGQSRRRLAGFTSSIAPKHVHKKRSAGEIMPRSFLNLNLPVTCSIALHGSALRSQSRDCMTRANHSVQAASVSGRLCVTVIVRHRELGSVPDACL
jgi:hypothetical protein